MTDRRWEYEGKEYVVVEELKSNHDGYPISYYVRDNEEKLLAWSFDIGDVIMFKLQGNNKTAVYKGDKSRRKLIGIIRNSHVDDIFLPDYDIRKTSEHYRLVESVNAEPILCGVPPEDVFV